MSQLCVVLHPARGAQASDPGWRCPIRQRHSRLQAAAASAILPTMTGCCQPDSEPASDRQPDSESEVRANLRPDSQGDTGSLRLRLQVGLENKNRGGPGERQGGQGLGALEMGNRHLQLELTSRPSLLPGSAVHWQRALDQPTASTTAARVSGSRWISVMGKEG